MAAAAPPLILLIHNDPAEARLVQAALEEGQVRHELLTLAGGPLALDYLRRATSGAARPPNLILLDISQAETNGRQTLSALKDDPMLRAIPVIVLADVDSPPLVRDSYTRGANSYITKPFDLQQFFDCIHSLEDFWLLRATLPGQ